jgi:folylpolyglutamate synthase/dihydropteroate synthase
VAAVTNVAFDHAEHLGTSLAAIGREGDHHQAWRPSRHRADGDGLAAIRRRARRVRAPLAEVTPPAVLAWTAVACGSIRWSGRRAAGPARPPGPATQGRGRYPRALRQQASSM